MVKLNINPEVLTLALTRSTPQAISLIVNLLLIEITQTFGKTIGETSQMIAISSILGILTCLSMTFFATKFSSTYLHNLGLILCLLSAVGCIIAPAYSIFFLLYGLYTIGSSLVLPMTTTIMGELFSGEARSKGLGVVFAGPAAFYIMGYIIVGYISDWRLAFAYFAAPFLALSFVLAFRLIPVIEKKGSKDSIIVGLRSIFKSKSAVACLFSNSISGVWAVALALGATFYRQALGVSLSTVTFAFVGFSLLMVVGSLVGGRLVYQFGLKRANVVIRVIMGVIFILLMRFNNAVLALFLGFVLSFLSGLNMPAGSGLILSLIPEYRGSMMSLSSATGSIGSSLNLALMGYLLTMYGWATGALVVGILGIIGSLIIQLFVEEVSE